MFTPPSLELKMSGFLGEDTDTQNCETQVRVNRYGLHHSPNKRILGPKVKSHTVLIFNITSLKVEHRFTPLSCLPTPLRILI